MRTTFDDRRRIAQLNRRALEAIQLEKLNQLLSDIHESNRFYQHKLVDCPRQLESLDQLSEFPHTTKDELQPLAGEEPFATNRTYALDRYTRFHQTSGTHGRPLVVLDTADDWRWWIEVWQYVLDAAQVNRGDHALLAFSFGPFIGFWSAFDALVDRGALVVPGGGLTSLARLELIRTAGVSTLLCTPTYALRLAEVAAEHKINIASLPVKKIIVAGEPGGSVPATRARIEAAWDARVIDHAGATEIGPWGFADAEGHGLHVNEAHFLAEFVAIDSGHPAKEGQLAHLTLTTLGRTGAPLIRYRTGDLVRPIWPADGDCRFVLLEGGILSRADDMVIVRGVNIFPSAIEHILHGFPEVAEHRITVSTRGQLDEIVVDVEDHLNAPARIAEELRLRLGLKIKVRCVPATSLPRFEGKGRRFIDQRRK